MVNYFRILKVSFYILRMWGRVELVILVNPFVPSFFQSCKAYLFISWVSESYYVFIILGKMG